MAKMIDEKNSEFYGECLVWDSLANYIPNDVIVYYNRSVKRRMFDFCLLYENQGILVIEVKGWKPLNVIVSNPDHIQYGKNMVTNQSPLKQAKMYEHTIFNTIKDYFNKSPLVLSMVCYPFITEEEYLDLRLDVVSEPSQTLFKEDITNQNKLNSKINLLFAKEQVLPHNDLNEDLMNMIRGYFEPDYTPEKSVRTPVYYSKLHVLLDKVSAKDIETICKAYFEGEKQVLFINDEETYKSILSVLDSYFHNRNIQPVSNGIEMRYTKGVNLDQTSSSFRIFNFEMYLLRELSTISSSSFEVLEGDCEADQREIITKLASKTQFNLQQYELEHADVSKNILVEAGAGTGKTYSMVSRIAYLCNKRLGKVMNIDEEIAMVTFTNDAADNMKVRIKKMFMNYYVLTGKTKYLKYIEDVDRARISTIHKFAIGLLREATYFTGIGYNFSISSDVYLRESIFDTYLSKFFVCMERDNPNMINEFTVPVYQLKEKIIQVANQLLNKSVDIETIKRSELGEPLRNIIPYFNDLFTEVIQPAQREYLETIRSRNALDLQECIIHLARIIKEKDVINYLKLKYFFIDEFQDTDDVQIQLFKDIQSTIQTNLKLFVVGDLKQSIYRFRGANLSAFKVLMSDYEDEWNVYHLNINYRTDSRLLDMYHPVFAEMKSQDYLPYESSDRLISFVRQIVDNENLLVCKEYDNTEENGLYEVLFNAIYDEIDRIKNDLTGIKNNQNLKTIAILVRTNKQVEQIVNQGKKRGIDIETKSGGDLFQLPPTIDLYKLVAALMYSNHNVYLVNFIESNYIELNLDYDRLYGLDEKEKSDEIFRVLDQYFKRVMGCTWRQIINNVHSKPILHVLRKLYNALQPWKQYSANPYRQVNYMDNYELLLEKILQFARVESVTLNDVLMYLQINIVTDQKEQSRLFETSDEERIRVICTTVHKSKGLEYGTVILPVTDKEIENESNLKVEADYTNSLLSYIIKFDKGAEEVNTNFELTEEMKEQACEESRILYVALTRAIRNCIWLKNSEASPKLSWSTLMEV